MRSDPVTRFRCAALRSSGATDIRIVHALNADAARERLIAAGLEPLTIEAVGPSLTQRLAGRLHDTWRHFRVRQDQIAPPGATADATPILKLLLPIARWLMAGCLALMLGTWSLVLITMGWTGHVRREQAAAIASYRDHVTDARIRTLAQSAMLAPSLTETLGHLAAILPAETSLSAATRDRTGALWIELDTSDPDLFRPILVDDPIFRSMKEVSQVQTNEGTIRITWKGVPR